MTLFKEMVYKVDVEEDILVDGSYLGYRYLIISRGQFPCAYIVLESWHPCYMERYDSLDILCHGDLSYSEFGLRGLNRTHVVSNEFWVIGWDYAHLNDFHGGLCEYGKAFAYLQGKKWTTQEMLDEVHSVIEQLNFINTRELLYV